jgi:hypothetical protein
MQVLGPVAGRCRRLALQEVRGGAVTTDRALLDRVGQLVRQQALSRVIMRCVPSRREDHVRPDSVSERAHRIGRRRGGGVRMDADVAEVPAEMVLEEPTRTGVERLSGGAKH